MEMKAIKKFFCTMFCLLLALATIGPVNATAASSIHWGLSFKKPGETPVGEATAEYLADYNACFTGDQTVRPKTIYLTFDAGYENGYTKRILDCLKEKNVPAAFFLVGTYIKSEPNIVKRMADEGHIVCNHTMSHKDMTTKDVEGFTSELKQVEELYAATVGSEMKKYYRPPEGVFNEENLVAASGLGYKTVLWSIAYADWNKTNQPSAEQAFKKIMPRLHPGAILLLHSTSATNAEILPELIDRCRALGFSFKSLDEL